MEVEELFVNHKITASCHTKHVSKPLYLKLETKKRNFEKPLG